MMYVKVAVIISIIVAGILFGVSNQQGTSLHFFSLASKEFPLYLVLFVSFISGTLIAFIYNILSDADLRAREKKAAEEVKQLEKILRDKETELKANAVKARVDNERTDANGEASGLAQKPQGAL
jgi:uncharacterized integral membrane protein